MSNPPITIDTTWPLLKPQIWGDVSYQALPENRRRALFDTFHTAIVTAADTVVLGRIVTATAAAALSASAAALSTESFSDEAVEQVLQGVAVGEAESVARGVFLSRGATGRQMTVAEQVEAIMAAQEATRRDGGDNERMEEMMRVQVWKGEVGTRGSRYMDYCWSS